MYEAYSFSSFYWKCSQIHMQN